MRIHGKGSKAYGTAEDMIAEIERLNAKVAEVTADRNSKVRLLDLANKALERAGSIVRLGGKIEILEDSIVFADTAEEIEQRMIDDYYGELASVHMINRFNAEGIKYKINMDGSFDYLDSNSEKRGEKIIEEIEAEVNDRAKSDRENSN